MEVGEDDRDLDDRDDQDPHHLCSAAEVFGRGSVRSRKRPEFGRKSRKEKQKNRDITRCHNQDAYYLLLCLAQETFKPPVVYRIHVNSPQDLCPHL